MITQERANEILKDAYIYTQGFKPDERFEWASKHKDEDILKYFDVMDSYGNSEDLEPNVVGLMISNDERAEEALTALLGSIVCCDNQTLVAVNDEYIGIIICCCYHS